MSQDDRVNATDEAIFEPVDLEEPHLRILAPPRLPSDPRPVDVESQGSGLPDPGGLY